MGAADGRQRRGAARPCAGATGVRYPVLVPNLKGLEAALAAGADEIAVFGAASESFSQKNINCSIAESLDRFRPVVAQAIDLGVRVRGYVSCVVGCPYEGEIAPAAVVRVARELHAMGCFEISLGDTIGVGTPRRTAAMLAAVMAEVPVASARHPRPRHLRPGAGQRADRAGAGRARGRQLGRRPRRLPLRQGCRGQCRDRGLLVYMLDGMGVRTGVDLDGVIAAGQRICAALQTANRSRVALARSRQFQTTLAP